MTETHRTTLGSLLLAAAMLAAPSGGAAQDSTQRQVEDARLVAARVQSFYDQTQSVEAHFYQTYYSRLYGSYQRSSGRLVFAKPGRMRFDYARPNGKVIVSDGSKLTLWEPGDEGGPGQFAEQDVGDHALPGAFSFLTGQGRLEQDYTFRLLDEGAFRWSGHVLELRPRRPDPRYRRILLFVDAHPARAGVVHRLRIDDHEGNRNKLELRRLRFDRGVARSVFAFRPPAGARRM